MSVEKEILKHLFTDIKNFKVVHSKSLKPAVFIEEEDSGDINKLKVLFEIASDYYRNYNSVLDRESLIRVLSVTKANVDVYSALLAAYDEVTIVDATSPIAFLIDTAKKEFKKARIKASMIKASDIYRSNDLDNIIPYLQKEFFTITHNIDETSSEASLSESADHRAEMYAKKSKGPGVFTGFPTFDKATNGLYPGQLGIIAAATSEGKSAMLLNIAHNAWKSGKRVLYITIENYRDDFFRRFDSLSAMIPYAHLKDSNMSDDEKERLAESIEYQRVKPNVFYVVDKPAEATPEFIEAKINDLLPMEFDLLVVDYLHIMHLNSKQRVERDQYFGILASELRRIGRLKQLPVLTAVQVNREGMKEKGNMYGVQHIALSQFISNHADILLSLRAIDPAQAMASGIVDLEAAFIKHRDGPKARFSIKANFERMKMEEQNIACEEARDVTVGLEGTELPF